MTFINVVSMDVDNIYPTKNVRVNWDDQLMSSLHENGLQTPILVYPVNLNAERPSGLESDPLWYAIKDGNRRYTAAKKLGWTQLPCVIVDPPADYAELLADQLVVNEHRQGLSYLEKAKAYKELRDAGWPQVKIAHHIGESESNISLAISLLNADPSIQAAVECGSLSPSAVEPLLSLPKDVQSELCSAACRARTVRAVKSLVSAHKRLLETDVDVRESDIPDDIDPLELIPVQAIDEAILNLQSARRWPINNPDVKRQTRERLNALKKEAEYLYGMTQ